MKKSLRYFLTLVLTAQSLVLLADEGMWLPLLIERLNYEDMRSKGLHLTAEEIYSVNHSSLKDAIVRLGRGFCTAEVVSGEGLLLTNHHCAYDFLQTHSTVQNDILTNGFWAQSHEEELPNDGLTASFLVRIEDVTSKILSEITPEMDEDQRASVVARMSSQIGTEAGENGEYEAVVKEFFQGNEYYLFVSQTFPDVRLVGAPPEAVGKFGGDTDNWMWPRHTGDFALLRIYAGPDGRPAAFSQENTPLKSKHHLPISLNGVKPGDFTMVMGYPGTTDRYLTSYGVNFALDLVNPTRIKVRDKKLALLRQDMNRDPKVRLQYAAKYAHVSNYWKYFIGQSQGLVRLGVVDQKKEIENKFREWYQSDPGRERDYGEALGWIKTGYQELKEPNLTRIYLQEAVFGSEILPMAYGHRSLEAALEQDLDPGALSDMVEGLRQDAGGYFKDYNPPTDQLVTAALLDLYYKNVKSDAHPDIFEVVGKKFKGNMVRYVADIFESSVFATENRYLNFLESPSLKVLQKDPAYLAINSIMDNYTESIRPKIDQTRAKIERGDRLFIDGLRKMEPEKKYYPDANSTLRLTYGQVLDYRPKDGIIYDYVTSAKGIIEKEDAEDPEFIVPSKLMDLINQRDFGPYGQDGKLFVGFISNNDITGGNSGSPVINGNGELIGIAFDGNWEAMSGDIAFEPVLQRCISVDIRYVLFVIDKFAGAGHLVEEMTLHKQTTMGSIKKD